MADLKLQSSDGNVSVDVNAGLGGLHRVTVTCNTPAYNRVFQPSELQELADLLAPAVVAEATKVSSGS